MKKFIEKLKAKIQLLIYGPPCSYPCCEPPDEEKRKKSGAIAY